MSDQRSEDGKQPPQDPDVLSKKTDSVDDCPVCLQPIVNVNKVVLKVCSHVFCKQCIDEWWKVKNECPVCRCKFKDFICNGIVERFEDVYEEMDDSGLMQTGVAVLGLHYYMAQRIGRLRVPSHQLSSYILGRPDVLRRQLYR